VNGCDLRNATHDQAVDVIRNATSPVRFLVQSLATAPGVCISLCLTVWMISIFNMHSWTSSSWHISGQKN